MFDDGARQTTIRSQHDPVNRLSLASLASDDGDDGSSRTAQVRLMKHPRRVLLTMTGRLHCRAACGGFDGHRAGSRVWLRRLRSWRQLAASHATHHLPRARRLAARPPSSPDSPFHTIDGERYWDERAYYAFTLEQIEREIEAPPTKSTPCASTSSAARSTMTHPAPAEDTGSVLASDPRQLAQHDAQPLWPARPRLRRARAGEAARIQRRHADLDLRGGGVSMELAGTGDRAALARARRPVQFAPRAPDRGVEGSSAGRRALHLTGADRKCRGRRHAGLPRGQRRAGRARHHPDRHRGHRTAPDDGRFVDLDNRVIALAFKLYPWEWMFRDAFGAQLAGRRRAASSRRGRRSCPTRACCRCCGRWCRGIRTCCRPFSRTTRPRRPLGASFVRKPLYSREGANVALVSGGVTLAQQQGPYGAEGFVRQAFASLPNFSNQYPVLGSWLVDHTPCGLSIREDENRHHRQQLAVPAARDHLARSSETVR